MENYYEILNIEKNASEKEIKRAYARLLRQFPPETHPEEFKKIRKAYEALSNDKNRGTSNIIDSTNTWEPKRAVRTEQVKDQNLDREKVIDLSYRGWQRDRDKENIDLNKTIVVNGKANKDEKSPEENLEIEKTILLDDEAEEEEGRKEGNGANDTVVNWTIVVENEPKDEPKDDPVAERIVVNKKAWDYDQAWKNEQNWAYNQTSNYETFKSNDRYRAPKTIFGVLYKVMTIGIGVFVGFLLIIGFFLSLGDSYTKKKAYEKYENYNKIIDKPPVLDEKLKVLEVKPPSDFEESKKVMDMLNEKMNQFEINIPQENDEQKSNKKIEYEKP